ncbi:MAG: galactose-1-phosphate uridylyltransferase, partial [Gemmatimonadetes bacterium]|nr:galactose-1-phosphate uridylyltransferase [Gemmatimonadota bacterium]NIS01047.1 galactose-1-phosphate uridylyltransferase [Gemmatimonadota bacterium]NIT66701.1 galactose-1-phosphate uridylyltransferase [Gemmatimonadota bacterium]NIU53867.1 galactose-1-phosphate uridylyltransferase [Gemmatimonadota bacterium]NIV23318.1 galactose-1-phosphate uridylyltransferase [Gemmatimonadota bacterium]
MDVFRAYRSRFGAAARDRRVKHVIIFKNQGFWSGASMAHSHAQLAALPLVPPGIQRAVTRSPAQ